MGIVDRLQALDERFLPWAKPRAPETPPEWTPEVGPLVSVKRLREVIAWWSAGLGLLVVVAAAVTGRVLVGVIGTLVTAGLYGVIMPLVARGWLEPGLGLARPVPADTPLTGPGSMLKRSWPWLAAIVAVFVILALPSGTTSGGIVLGAALWQYREARCWGVGRRITSRGVATGPRLEEEPRLLPPACAVLRSIAPGNREKTAAEPRPLTGERPRYLEGARRAMAATAL